MGRKIKPRKHRGVKDPLIQIARRNACPTINAAPSKPDDQELPKSVLEIQRLCALAESRSKPGQGNKKHTNSRYDPIDSLYLYDKDPKLPGMRRKDRGVPRVVQNEDEPDDAYMLRFSAAAQEFINEVQLENKHGVEFELKSANEEVEDSESKDKEAEKESNSNESTKSKKTEQDVNMFQSEQNSSKKHRRSRSGKHLERGTKPNKKERRKQRLATLKKEEHYEDELISSEDEMDFSLLKDDVKFGEVVHRPPEFTAKPRGTELRSKPGTKDLLLKQIFSGSKSKETRKINTSKLSEAQKHFMEKERVRVVQAYRDLKAKKMKTQ